MAPSPPPRLHPVYLVDLFCLRPPDELLMDVATVSRVYEENEQDKKGGPSWWDPELRDWVDRIFKKSGLGDNCTFLPKSLHPKYVGVEQQRDHLSAEQEARETVLPAVEGLLQKTGLRPSDIDILVTTCSLYCPTPSLASMVINEFDLRPDVASYHLGGMGCANGVVGVNLVHDLLQAHPNSNALFVTVEVCTTGTYVGRDKARLLPNIIFRMGAAAVLLSNKPSMARCAKYELVHNVRVCSARREAAYRCIWYGPDDEGHMGVRLGTDVVAEAGRTLTRALATLGPKLLTVGEMARFAWHEARRRLSRSPSKPYVPSFTDCAEHFLIHAGGAKVLDGVQSAMRLADADLAPSRQVLYDYGNVSSSSTWYGLACIESLRGVAQGDKVVQIGVGSGVKVGVNVWQARRSITDVHKAWVHRLPEAPAFPSKPSRARLAATLMRALLVGLLLLVLLSAVLLAALGPSRLAPSLAAVDGQLADGAAAVKEVVLAAGEQVQQVAVGSLGAVAQVAARLAETVQAVQLADGQQEL